MSDTEVAVQPTEEVDIAVLAANENTNASIRVTPEPAAKKPRAKKAATKKAAGGAKAANAAHPTYREMIISAIKTLKERNGSSRIAILKYIMKYFQVGDSENGVNGKLKLALTRMVASKTLKQTSGTGASGSFKIANETAGTPKKKVVKQVAQPKKTTPSPKKAAPSPKKAKETKKKAAKPKVKKTKKEGSTKAKKPAAKNKTVAAPKKNVAQKKASPKKIAVAKPKKAVARA